MKKSKVFIPILTLSTLCGLLSPLITSCANNGGPAVEKTYNTSDGPFKFTTQALPAQELTLEEACKALWDGILMIKQFET